MITALILIPLIGALLVAVLPRAMSRTATLGIITAAAAVVAYIMLFFNTDLGGLQLVEMVPWIPAIGVDYLVAVDGLSLLLVLLTTLVVPFGLIASKNPTRGFCSLLLLTMGALYGTFTAHNFILWFLFYEMSLIPAFLLIKLWGGEKRDAAATQFFVFTFLGSVAMLVAMLGVYHTAGTFNFHEFGPIGQNGLLTGTAGWLMFTGVCLGIAVKVPVFPFHTWLPDAYTAAPTGVSMVLTGILSKMGVYAALRLLLPLFPQQIQAAQPILLTLVVLSIVLSTLAALAQQDLKRMVAYISINHLGYCMLAIVAIGSAVAAGPEASAGFAPDVQAALGGVFMQIFNHGITAAALFYWAGLLEERRGSRLLGDYGGLMQQTPQLCAWMSLAMFSSLGLPGLNGFIGEILIFKGAFNLAPIATACAGFGLLITAGVFLRAMQKLFSGPIAESCKTFPNLTLQEKLIVIPVSILMLALGIAPGFMFHIFNSTVTQMANLFS